MGYISLGLIIIVVRDEVLNGVFRKKLLKLSAKLRGKYLIMSKHKRRPIEPCDDACHGKGLAGTCNTQKHLLVYTVFNSADKCFYCLRLITHRCIR